MSVQSFTEHTCDRCGGRSRYGSPIAPGLPAYWKTIATTSHLGHERSRDFCEPCARIIDAVMLDPGLSPYGPENEATNGEQP